MGEYFRIVNLDKRQFFEGHSLNMSGKFSSLQERPLSSMLVWVLSKTTHLGKLCFRGTWDGDRVVIAGDEGEHRDVYEQSESYQDISVPLIEEWIDLNPSRAFEYWERGLVDDEGQFVMNSDVLARRRKDARFPSEKWEARQIGRLSGSERA